MTQKKVILTAQDILTDRKKGSNSYNGAIMKYLFTLLLILFFSPTNADIHKIPPGELKNIQHLFGQLINNHDFSYTLFGSKPMSLADLNFEVPSELPFFRKIRSKFILTKSKKCLSTWYKYKDEFALKDFIFLDQEYDFVKCLLVVLINKKNLLKTLHDNEAIFRQELGEDFSPEIFLEQLATKQLSLAQATKKSQRLLGIMLGYGVRNATLFQERFDLMSAISKRKKENLPTDDLLAKLEFLESQAGEFSELEEDAIIPPLYFLADTSHPETIELKNRYEQERREIETMAKQPHFMDKVLERLVKP